MNDLSAQKTKLPTLNTGRCIIRLAQIEDTEAVITYFSSNRAHLADGGPAWPSDFLTIDYWHKQIEQSLEDFHGDVAVRFFLFDRANPSVVVGSANLNNIVRGAAQYCNLGYSIAQIVAALMQSDVMLLPADPVLYKFRPNSYQCVLV